MFLIAQIVQFENYANSDKMYPKKSENLLLKKINIMQNVK